MAKYRTQVMLTLCAVFWGGTFVAGKIAVQGFPPSVAAFYRFLVASLLLAAFLLYRRAPIQLRKEDLGKLFLLGLSGIFIYNIFFFTGLQYASPSNGALVIAATPACTTILARFALRETIVPRQLLGMALSFTGVAVVITRGSWEAVANFSFHRGELMFIACMAGWSVFSIVGKKIMDRLSPLEAITFAVFTGTALFAAFFHREILQTPWSAASPGAWGAVFYLAFFGTFLGFVWWYQGVRELGAAPAAVFINLVPPSAMVISLFWGDPVNFYQVAGAALVIGGVYLTTRKAKLQAEASKTAPDGISKTES